MRALRNILDMEAANGFADKAVAGGLDRFLETLRGQAGTAPELKTLDELGLLSIAYAELEPARRERWADEARRFLGDARSAARGVRRQAPPPESAASTQPAGNPLDVPLSALRTVNRTHAAAIGRMLIRRRMLTTPDPTVRDLLYLFPLRHMDRRERTSVARLRVGEEQTVEAVLWRQYHP